MSGCASLYPDGIPETPVEPSAAVIDTTPLDTITVTPLSRQPWDFELPSVAIVMSNSSPAYADVAVELAQRLENYAVYDLGDESRPPVNVLRLINDSDSSVVVAIGLRAAQSSVAMSEKPVVFSQVFNHQDHGLLQENTRGVAAIPPLDAQLAAWKKLDPTMVRVGVIIGEGHDDLLDDARRAAEKHGIDLRVQITHSDQETLYFFRRMVRDIDGFWLFPDNRILSGRVLQEMLDDANRQQVPVAVPSDSMLEMGAALSISTVATDIARTIVRVIREVQSGHLESLPPITQLSEIRVETNGTVQVVER
ncbi:MAG: ABC transporter substrate binding protein [Woeseiaceae bacterium]